MLYSYEALDLGGKARSGTAEAGSPAEARALLRDQGLHALRLEGVGAVDKGARAVRRPGGASWLNLSGRRLDLLVQASRHLALLLKAGLPLAQATGILATQVTDGSFKTALLDVSARVREGTAFDQALALYPRYFPELYVQVARAGIEAGELPRVLLEISSYYARQKKLRDRVVSALTYPALMGLVGLLVLVFLLTFVVPKVTAVLLEERRALPWPTEVLLVVSRAASQGGWIALPAALFLGLLLVQLLRAPAARRVVERVIFRIPVVGSLYRDQAVARWAGTLGTLVASGIPVAQALAVVRGTAGSVTLADDVARLEKEVTEGVSLSEAVKRSRVLPPSLGFVVGIGEETGDLPDLLREVARSYDEEVETTSTRLTDLLNPVLIVFLGLVVGFIVAAILLPITDFSQVH